jgi:hypothetical protein
VKTRFQNTLSKHAFKTRFQNTVRTTQGSKIAAGLCHQLGSPVSSPFCIGKRHIHLQPFANQSQATGALGFIGEGCIARSESHEFNQFEFANIEASLILKSTRFKAAPLQLPISELCTAAAVKFGEL